MVKRAGINKHISWHCARHSFAVNILNNGANIKTVASLLGHSGLKHTEKYTRAVDSLKQQAIDSLPPLNIDWPMSSNYDADGSVVNIGGDMMGGTIIYTNYSDNNDKIILKLLDIVSQQMQINSQQATTINRLLEMLGGGIQLIQINDKNKNNKKWKY